MKLRSAFLVSVLALPLLASISGCGDAAVDPETAEYVLGEGKDTITVPDLSKTGSIMVGFTGSTTNSAIWNMVALRTPPQFSIDSLSDGTIAGVKNLYVSTEFGNPDDAAEPHALYPLRALTIAVPALVLDASGQGMYADLLLDPLAGPLSREGGVHATLWTDRRIDMATGDILSQFGNSLQSSGYARIQSLDAAQRIVQVRIDATLYNVQSDTDPSAMTFRLLLNLHY